MGCPITDPERNQEASDHGKRRGLLEEPEEGVFDKIRGKMLDPDRSDLFQDVAEMGMPEGAETAKDAGLSIHVRTMGIPGLVGGLVMLAVLGRPNDGSPFGRRASQKGKDVLDEPVSLERPVGEEPVIPYGDPEAGSQIHAQEDPEIDGRDLASGDEPCGGDDGQGWDDDDEDKEGELCEPGDPPFGVDRLGDRMSGHEWILYPFTSLRKGMMERRSVMVYASKGGRFDGHDRRCA